MTFAVLTGVFVASLAGSLHCLAMCGPLAGLHGGIHTARLALVHSLGRLATYLTLGIVAGALGRAVDLAGRLGNVQRAATILAGLVIVGWGVWTLGVARGWFGATTRLHGARFASGLARIRSKPPRVRAWLTGVLTGLIPCGWLWAFVVMAAGTGSVIGGGALMAAFWLGTVPAMVGLLAFAGPLLSRIRARVPALTAIVLIVMGLGTLALRWRDAGSNQVTTPHCHQHGGAS